jgi:hypothetical protein
MDRIYVADTFIDFSFGDEGEKNEKKPGMTEGNVIEIETVVLEGIEEEPAESQKPDAESTAEPDADQPDAMPEKENEDAPAEEAEEEKEEKEEGDFVELSVLYPSNSCGMPEGRTVQLRVPIVWVESEAPAIEETAKEEPMAEEPVAEEAVQEEPVAEEPAVEEVAQFAAEEEVAEEAPAAEEPAAEVPSLAEAAEQMLEEREPLEVPVFAVATEEAAASAERASELSSIVPATVEEDEEEINPFDGLQSRTFAEKLAALPEPMRLRYEALNAYLATFERMRVVEGKKYRTYRSGRVAFVKMAIRGKTLSAYFASDPEKYEESKYIFTDESGSTAFENYPMRLRLSSDRQERWAEELVDIIAEENGIAKLSEEEVQELFVESDEGIADPFSALKRRKQKNFKQRLRAGSPLLRARYKAVKDQLLEIDRVRLIESNKGETYKRGSIPIAKLTVKGKTLNAYLALPPAEYAETKYVFLDASEIKAYEKYPMRVKISSDRQQKWLGELIMEIVKRENLKLK